MSKCKPTWPITLSHVPCDTFSSKNIMEAGNIKCLQPMMTHTQHPPVHNIEKKYVYFIFESKFCHLTQLCLFSQCLERRVVNDYLPGLPQGETKTNREKSPHCACHLNLLACRSVFDIWIPALAFSSVERFNLVHFSEPRALRMLTVMLLVLLHRFL